VAIFRKSRRKPQVIEDRWHLGAGEGAAQLFVGAVTRGIMGGGFLYTNSESISLGLVIGMEQLRSRGGDLASWQLLDDFKQLPGVRPLVAGGTAPALPHGPVRLAWRLEERSKATGVTAADLMSTPPVTIGAAAAVTEAARVMQSRRVKRLAVIGQDDRLVGITSRTDVLSLFERPDEHVRDEVIKAVMPANSHWIQVRSM
jgi:CBS domain-containing protein